MVNLQWADFMNANWLTFQKDKKPALDILNRFSKTIIILQIPQFFAICSVFYGWLNICTICLIGVCCWNFFIVMILFCPCNNRKKSLDQRCVWVLMKEYFARSYGTYQLVRKNRALFFLSTFYSKNTSSSWYLVRK